MYSLEIDDKWNAYWREHKAFRFDEKDTKKQTFVIDTPPPFTSGELHMGQVFWVCYVDSIARYMRMMGRNVLYPQGWDTQGFPTELKVEQQYGKQLPRKEFYGKCVEVAEANMKLMKEQMLKMGASFDPKYEYVTMSKDYRAKVQLSLLLMHKKNMVYRAKHPVEWCTSCNTSIAREETKEVTSKTNLNYIEFSVKGTKKKLMIATTRPEYLHVCVALAVNPGDERYTSVIGKHAEVPIFNRKVEIIADPSIDKEYGTGAEMICTFGDKNDVLLAYKHKLEFLEGIDGTGMLKNAGKFNGMSALQAREEVVKELDTLQVLKKREQIDHAIKVHDRCSTPIELIFAMQWFIKTKQHADEIREIARQIEWIPEYSRQRLEDWCDFIEWDWNISRKRVFGTPIPFWYCEKCDYVLAPEQKNLPVDPAIQKPDQAKCPKCSGKIKGETDVCDVWVDSSITPLIIAGWPDNKVLLKKAFPSSMRIQGSDIIRTWAFYTVFRTYFLAGNKPFERLLINGMILGTDGKEMHKSWGNGVSPEELLKKYPVDSIRLWVALSGGIGKDRQFSYEEMDYTMGVITKLWNSALFVQKALEGSKLPELPSHSAMGVFDIWILNRLNSVTKEVSQAYQNLGLYEAASRSIDFYWHEFCDYYLENVKHRVYSTEPAMKESRAAALSVLRHVLLTSLELFAPIMPHLTEELNQVFRSNSIFKYSFPAYAETVKGAEYAVNGLLTTSVIEIDHQNSGAFLNNIIADVRKAKAANRLALNKPISSINIKVPDEYYNAVLAAKDELTQICKANSITVKRDQKYSADVKI